MSYCIDRYIIITENNNKYQYQLCKKQKRQKELDIMERLWYNNKAVGRERKVKEKVNRKRVERKRKNGSSRKASGSLRIIHNLFT